MLVIVKVPVNDCNMCPVTIVAPQRTGQLVALKSRKAAMGVPNAASICVIVTGVSAAVMVVEPKLLFTDEIPPLVKPNVRIVFALAGIDANNAKAATINTDPNGFRWVMSTAPVAN